MPKTVAYFISFGKEPETLKMVPQSIAHGKRIVALKTVLQHKAVAAFREIRRGYRGRSASGTVGHSRTAGRSGMRPAASVEIAIWGGSWGGL